MQDEGTTILTTERLYARGLERDDEELFCRLFTDAHTMQYIGAPWSLPRARRSFHKLLELPDAPAAHGFFALVEKTSGRAIGICTLKNLDTARRDVEIGIMLSPACCSRGFAKEALRALTAHAFASLPIETVWAQVADGHLAIHRILTDIGYGIREGAAPAQSGIQCSIWSIARSDRAAGGVCGTATGVNLG